MKAEKPLLILAGLILLVAGAYVYFFCGPYRFAEVSLREASLQHFRSRIATGATWSSSPADAADEYLHWWCHPSDRPKRSLLEITVRQASEQEAVVTVIDRFGEDDSISVTCDRLTLHRQSGAWIPVRHQAARQGRGRIGWTTKPTT